MMKHARWFYALSLVLTMSCDGDPDDAKLSLLDGEPGPGAAGAGPESESDPDALSPGEEAQRLSEMQLLRLTPTDPTQEPFEMSAELLVDSFIWGKCELMNGVDVTEPTAFDCGTMYRQAVQALCVAGNLLEIAGSAHAPISLDPYPVTVTPQPAGPRHRVAALAAVWVDRAAGIAWKALLNEAHTNPGWVGLYGTSFNCLSGSCSCGGVLDEVASVASCTTCPWSDPEPFGSRFAGLAAETFHLFKEAASLSADIGLAVADGQVSDTGSTTEGLRRQFTAAELSRSAIAHLLVGGDPGYNGQLQPTDLCSTPELSTSALKALSLMREAALSPEDILALGLDIDDLLEDDYRITGTGSPDTHCGSLRERLYQQWDQDPALADTSLSIGDIFGLSHQDFRDARQYMAQEIRVFSRSLTATFESGLVCNDIYGSGDPDTYPRFAATAAEPHVMDPVYWSTIARYTSGAHIPDFPGSFAPPTIETLLGPTPEDVALASRGGVSTVVDDYVARASRVMSTFAIDGTPMGDEIAGLMHLLLSDAQLEHAGRLYVMRWTDGDYDGSMFSHMTWPVLSGVTPADNVTVVQGEEGLRCALYGNIEGAPCSTATFNGLRLGTLDRDLRGELVASFTFWFGASVADQAAENYLSQLPDREGAFGVLDTSSLASGSRLYLVKPKPGVTAATAGPGEFSAVTGFRHLNSGPTMAAGTDIMVGPRDLDIYGVVPDFDRTAAEYLRPSTEWCAEPKLSCAGTTFDARLTLETELTDDGSAFEDSWRHYLTLARQAADEADELGLIYLDAEASVQTQELEQIRFEDRVRERRERELEELQEICGTAIDTEKLFELLVPNGDIANAAPTTTCDLSTPCSAGLSCFAGYCIKPIEDLIKENSTDPDIYRLGQCLGNSSTNGFATPGDRYLCILLQDGNKNRVCEAEDGTRLDPSTCPVEWNPNPGVDEDPSGCTFGSFTPDAQDVIEYATPLEYFASLPGPDAPGAGGVCHEFRRLRGNAVAHTMSEKALASALESVISDTFYFENVQQTAKNIGWQSFAPFGTLTYNGQNTYFPQPGQWPCLMVPDPPTGPASWPINAAVDASCKDSLVQAGDSFFCQKTDCSSIPARAQWTQRATLAVLALRAMAYRGSSSSLGEREDGSYGLTDLHDLQGVGLLARAPIDFISDWRPTPLVGNPPFLLPSSVTPWVGSSTLRITPVIFQDPIQAAMPPGSYYQRVKVVGAVNPMEDDFYYYPDGTPITTTEAAFPTQTTLVQGDIGSFPRPWDALSDPCGANQGSAGAAWSSKAPYWWGGMSTQEGVFGQQPRAADTWCLGEDGQPNYAGYLECMEDFPNHNWVRRYLAGNLRNDQATAPVNYLWHTVESCDNAGTPGARLQPAHDSLLPNWRRSLRNGSPGSEYALHRMLFDFPPVDDTATINRAVLDAVELLCHHELEYRAPPSVLLGSPPQFNSIEDLDEVGAYFQLLSAAMNNAAGRLVFANLPAQAVDALKLTPVNSAYPALGGQLAESILALRGALIQLASAAPGIAHEVDLIGKDMVSLRSRLESLRLTRDRVRINNLAQAVQRTNDCSAALMPSISASAGPGILSGPSISFNTGSIFVCANAAAQIEFSGQVADIDDDLLARDGQDAIDEFGRSMEERRDVMRRYADQIAESNEIVNEHLARIDAVQSSAKRAVQRALFMQTAEAEKQAEISQAMRGRAKLEKELYERALRSAKRMAFLAKRAIEQRLGMRLADMHEDLPLVEAPSTWEARACTTTGLSTDTFRVLGGRWGDFFLGRYADQFIGDYVRNLENLVESYPLYYNFHEGQDTTVISLRDDVLESKTLCGVPSGNLLFHSGDLDRIRGTAAPDELDPGFEEWLLEDCALDENGVALGNCIRVDELTGDSPVPTTAGPGGHELFFGDDGTVCNYADVGDPNRCGYTGNSVLRQDLFVQPGTYLLSWYTKDVTAVDDLVYLRDETGATLSGGAIADDPASVETWRRYYSLATVPVGQTVSVVIGQPSTAPASATVARVMLEDLRRTSNGVPLVPRPYADNGGALTRTIPACADALGREFPTEWRYQCAHLCPNGFGAACGKDAASTRCYYELTFGLSQREIEEGDLLRYAGFAHGNFNYRLDSVAANFVGTGTRNCDDLSSSSCYSAGFIPYSLEHSGPYYVRNHIGGNYEAKLFKGNVEHARGLAAERLITNPISSADRDLMQDYWRGELRGRPLDGIFTLRVWDEPGVNFAAIEDVQLVLNYRYWTRFD